MEKTTMSSFIKKNMMWVILIVLMIVFAILSPNFRSFRNLMNILTQNAYFIIATVGVAMIMISGGTDLSVGNAMAVMGVSVALMMEHGLPVPLAVIIGVLIGALLGGFNGFSSNLLKIHPMIVTLATMTMFKGISYILSGSKSFYNFDQSYLNIGQAMVGVISVPVIIMIIICILVSFVLNKTVFGRFIYAVGGNAETARLAGVNVHKIKFLTFSFAGALFGIASIILTSRGGSASSQIGPGVEFDAIIACVLGGVSFIGGAGHVSDAVVGCLILGVLTNGMQMIGMDVNSQYVVKGILLLVSIGYDTYQQQAKARKKLTK